MMASVSQARVAAVLALCLLLMAPATVRADLAVKTVLTGLNNPVRLVAPVGDERLFVVERTGLIRVFDRDGTERGTFIDLSSLTRVTNERGLLGLAFPPDYASTGRFYVNYTDDDAGSTTNSIIARYQVSPDPDIADAGSEKILLTLFQPASNHNGGHMEFGPDGMLYVGFGDGGGSGDPSNWAQNDQSLLGKMLRLDVSGPDAYSIPPDNPFTGTAPLDEIWAKGLRNPWCFAFDQITGDLYIADVGQRLWEEIDVQPASSSGGENYGWRLMEGNACFNPATNCNDGSLVLPVHEYDHGDGRCSISGGYVYRGSAIPSESGSYFFADWCSGQIWTLRWSEAGGVTNIRDRTAELTAEVSLGGITSFGQDGLGELYVIENAAGRIHRIVGAKGSPTTERSMGQFKGRW
jgi:glucose/arabinose dehydrogenase